MTRKPESGNYTCIVGWPGSTTHLSCTVHLPPLPAADAATNSSIKATRGCRDPWAPTFHPRSSSNGTVLIEKSDGTSLTCRASKLMASQTEGDVHMQLLPLENYFSENLTEPSSENTASTDLYTSISESDSPTTSSQATNGSQQPQKPCEFHHQRRTRDSVTIVFDQAVESCRGLYLCSAGVAPSLRSSVMLGYKKPDDEGHSDDDDDEEKERKKSSSDVDVLGLTVGVVFMVLLTGVAITCAVVWRKRMLRHHSRYMARVTSTSKAPLFINKDFAKGSENSELEEFPRKHIRFLDNIGKGTFGTVVMAETYNIQKQKKLGSSNRWKVVAVKMTLISEKKNEQLKKDFLNEVALMKSIPAHTNIITLYASCTAHDPYLMILEYAKHGDLRKYLQEHRTERNYANAAYLAYGVDSRRTGNYYSTTCSHVAGDKKKKYEEISIDPKTENKNQTSESGLITSRDVLSFALQICRGLDHLTINKIVHRDVAARNVLVCEHKVVKISDFGLARKVGEQDVYERSTKGLLPIRWMSPEALLYNQYTEKSDVWSFGVLLWELITLGSTPYPGLDSTTILEKIRHRELLICPPHCSAVVNNVMSSCWREDPHMRPSFSQLVQDVEKLLESEVEYLDLDQINDHEYSTLD
ncbi:hypothetical protein BsWGS_28996 [Bradybaena similaris]